MEPGILEQLSRDDTLGQLKTAVALLACGLLLLETRYPRHLSERGKQLVGALVAVAAITCHFHLLQPPYRNYYHRWDVYHYFIGAKYAKEIGYEGIYACSLEAEAQLGHLDEIRSTTIRNLEDDTLEAASTVLDDAPRCKDRFAAERWDGYVRDIAWFREVSGRGGPWWRDMQRDHGYNPSPVWTVAGHALTSLAPASDGFLKLLASIDVLLLAGVFVLLGWGFGWRASVVGAVFWGTQEPSSFSWVGGAFLRQDWLFLAILAVVLIRKKWFFAAGFALGYSALLRLFPVLFWTGPLLVIAAHLIRKRQMPGRHRRLLAGGLLSAVLLIPLSVSVAGTDAWPAFAEHITMHAGTPISNHMSLRTLFAASPDTRLKHLADGRLAEPARPWIDARAVRLERLRPWYHVTAAALVGLFVVAVTQMRSLWMAVALSPFLVMILTDPSCYYYSILILVAPLSRISRTLQASLPGLAAVGQALGARFGWIDDKFTALAALYLGFCVVTVAMFVRCDGLRRVAGVWIGREQREGK